VLIGAGLLTILLLTAATGYFVAQEFAYVAVDRGELQRLSQDGDAPARRALRVTSQLSFTLSGAQFGITVTALVVGYVSEPLLGEGLADALGFTGLSRTDRLSIALAAALLFSTLVQMVVGELAPKNLAISRATVLARWLSRSTLLYLALAGPVIRLFDRASTALLRAVGIEPIEELPQGATPEDLEGIIHESHTRGLLDADLSRLLDRALAFRHLLAEQVMTPRIDVTVIRADEPASRVTELLATGSSRFPVTGRDVDDIIGQVGVKELLAVPVEQRSTTPVRRIVTPPVRLPTSHPLPAVLERLRAERRQMAVVVDEYGGFAGVITFEDVAEEVVGEILDEDDADEPVIQRRPDGAWQVPARMRIDEVVAQTGLPLPDDEDFDTLGGLVLDRLGRTAEVGDVIELDGAAARGAGKPASTTELEVLAVNRHVPLTVLARQRSDQGADR
jgi:CBS domain containing-hemolysin-like protein